MGKVKTARTVQPTSAQLMAELRSIRRLIMSTQEDFDAQLQTLVSAQKNEAARVTAAIQALEAKVAATPASAQIDFAPEIATLKSVADALNAEAPDAAPLAPVVDPNTPLAPPAPPAPAANAGLEHEKTKPAAKKGK